MTPRRLAQSGSLDSLHPPSPLEPYLEIDRRRLRHSAPHPKRAEARLRRPDQTPPRRPPRVLPCRQESDDRATHWRRRFPPAVGLVRSPQILALGEAAPWSVRVQLWSQVRPSVPQLDSTRANGLQGRAIALVVPIGQPLEPDDEWVRRFVSPPTSSSRHSLRGVGMSVDTKATTEANRAIVLAGIKGVFIERDPTVVD